MNTAELREHLRNAAGGLEPPAEFAGAVLRGGRRRRARRRLAIAASVVAVVAMATSVTVVNLREDPPVQVADARLTAPTKGGLAGDQAFLDEVRRVWVRDLPYAPEARDRYYDDLRGEPHVYWAGNTPAGRAAIVLQPVYVHPNSQVNVTGPQTAEGLVAIAPGDGQLTVVATRVIGDSRPGDADCYKFGPEDRTVLMVDNGAPLHYALTPRIAAADDTGRMSEFDWRRAEPKDGVAIVTVPADVEPWNVIAYEGNQPSRQMATEEMPSIPIRASVYSQLRLPDPAFRLRSSLLSWGDQVWRLGEPLHMSPGELDRRWGHFHYYAGDPELVVSRWTIAAGLPDGRIVILKERQNGTAEPRLVARVAPNQAGDTWNLVDGGTVDHDAVLPVRFRLPGGGGWIVADKGKELRYRTSPAAPWQNAGRDAALLPANATEVLVDDLYVRL